MLCVFGLPFPEYGESHFEARLYDKEERFLKELKVDYDVGYVTNIYANDYQKRAREKTLKDSSINYIILGMIEEIEKNEAKRRN